MFNGPSRVMTRSLSTGKHFSQRWALRASRLCSLATFAWLLLATAAYAQTYTKLATLTPDIGKLPVGALVQGADGAFYGTAFSGGAKGNGSVFRITSDGALSAAYSFIGSPSDAAVPHGLAISSNGTLYGVSDVGGAADRGAIFSLVPGVTETLLYSFCESPNPCLDGQEPEAPLVQGSDGNLYGTTAFGGDGRCKEKLAGCGTVFKITPAGVLTTLYSFCQLPNCADGSLPGAKLAEGPDGSFYGVAGGANNPRPGLVYNITSDGVFKVVYDFCSQPLCSDGASPTALVLGNDGNLYGATSGTATIKGTIFQLTPQGTLTTLHTFNGLDGRDPVGPLVLASDGNLYGVTGTGGANGKGTIFRISSNGTFTSLYNFCSLTDCADGGQPINALVQGSDGNFYGTASGKGADHLGIIFKFSAP